MNLELRDKVVVVSGSSRGIGRGIASVLLAEGARIVITGREPASLDETGRYFQAKFGASVLVHGGDLNDPAVLDELEAATMNRWGRIDGLVANAGAVRPVRVDAVSEVDWAWYFDMNFKVARQLVERLLPHVEKGHGSVVVINSIAGLAEIGAPAPYSSAKAALLAYTRALACRMGPRGVRVNTIAPGNIQFPGGNWARREAADPAGTRRLLETRIPLRRFGGPEEIGALAAFLLSERAGFVTGACFVADGGQLAAQN